MTAREGAALDADGVDAIKRAGAWLLMTGIALAALESMIDAHPLFSLGIGAMAVDYVAIRLGVRWNEADHEKPERRRPRVVVAGASLGVGIGLLVAAIGLAVGALRCAISPIAWGPFALGTVRAGVSSVRDELLYRGIPLAVARGRVRDRWAVPFAALFGTAPLVLDPAARIESQLLAFASGLLFARLWRKGAGASLPCGAHFGWLLAVDVLLRGQPLDLKWNSGSLAADASAASTPASLAALIFVFLAAGTTVRLAWPSRAPG